MGWPERLDAMERALDTARATVDHGAPPDERPLPEATGPVPAALVPRAVALLAATRTVQGEVEGALHRTGEELSRIHARARLLGEDTAAPVYVDRRA